MDRRTFHKGKELVYIQGEGIFGSNFFGSNFTWVIDETAKKVFLEIDLTSNYKTRSKLTGTYIDIEQYDRREALPSSIQLFTIGEKAWRWYEEWELGEYDVWIRLVSKRIVERRIDTKTIGQFTLILE